MKSKACTPAAASVHWGGASDEYKRFENALCQAYQLDAESSPINCVSWFQADAYCRARGERLPTEVEWEYAARNGAAGDPFPWGTAPLDATRANLCDPPCAEEYTRAGFARTPLLRDRDGHAHLAPPGGYPNGSSRAGVVDLVGNVWEWTSSNFCSYPHHDCDAPEKVFRGGGWSTTLELNAHTTTRLFSNPEYRYVDIGFRCARDP